MRYHLDASVIPTILDVFEDWYNHTVPRWYWHTHQNAYCILDVFNHILKTKKMPNDCMEKDQDGTYMFKCKGDTMECNNYCRYKPDEPYYEAAGMNGRSQPERYNQYFIKLICIQTRHWECYRRNTGRKTKELHMVFVDLDMRKNMIEGVGS